MSRDFKNDLGLYLPKEHGVERRKDIAQEPFSDSTPFPETVELEDIDREFKSWVENDLRVVYEGREVPTHFLISNQRVSEYIQSWENVDINKNMSLNFKSISRETDPRGGTMYGSTRNIPGDRQYVMKRVEARDRNDRRYFIEYRMKQPFTVDLNYSVSIITNKLELLNEFNMLVNDRFKAIDCYIRPNGHFMAMKLTRISDESENSIDDRRYYSQTYNITVMAYIIRPDMFSVAEVPALKFTGFDDAPRKGYAEIEEDGRYDCENNSPYRYKHITLTINVDACDTKVDFVIDTPLRIKSVTTENVRWYEVKVNGKFAFDNGWAGKEGFEFNPRDEIRVSRLKLFTRSQPGKIIIEGIDWKTVYNPEEQVPGDELVEVQ